jgi:hypothetical protein
MARRQVEEMRRAGALLSLSVILAGCGSSGEDLPSLAVRQLSDGEKQALASSFSQKIGDPGAQFKWMPVIGAPVAQSSWIPTFSSTPTAKPVAYCGLVSERGGPFRIFSATISPGSGGLYGSGSIESVDSAPAGAAGGGAAERCKSLGYSNFNLAK